MFFPEMRRMNTHKTLNSWHNALKQGFPTKRKILTRMPFGQSMWEAFNKTDQKDSHKFLHRQHLQQMVTNMNGLLQGDIRNIIADHNRPENAPIESEWITAWGKIHGDTLKVSEDEQFMWRLEAFLHDVGKSLTHSRHPTRGQYLITRLKIKERDQLVQEIGPQKFRQLEKVVAFHDRFGVISTGEASFGILADTVDRGSTQDGAELAARTISHIMVINLIDIGASVPWGLISEKVRVVLGDWHHSCWDPESPLRQSAGDRGQFEELLLELAAKDERTIDRVARLLAEGYRRARGAALKDKPDESKWPDPQSIDFVTPARQALEAQCGMHWDDFRLDLAHVAKMDYLLYLVDPIVLAHWRKYRSPDRLAVCIVAVIQKLVDQFADLIRRRNRRSRIGIDLGILRDTPDVQNQIAELLTGDQADAAYGLEWLTHETGAWPF
jgi:hypothetical protein